MSKLAHEIRELKGEIVRLEKNQEIVAKGVARVIDLLKGGIKISVMPPQAQSQRKILVAGSNVKIESKGRRSP